nr:hypothetical protein [Nitrospinota bacterium]
MAYFKITKSAKTLTRSAIEYLDKDKDQLTKKQIEYNILYSTFKKHPTDELKQQIISLRADIGAHKKLWNDKLSSDIRVSGYLRKELYQQGYSKMTKKDQINLILDTWNKKLESISNKKVKHVGLRRFVLAPSVQDMLNVSLLTFEHYAEDSMAHALTHGDHLAQKNKQRINQFFDELVRDI